MKNIGLLLIFLSIVSCGDDTKETDTQKNEPVEIVATEIKEIEEIEKLEEEEETLALSHTENPELDKGFAEANNYLETPIEGTVWRSSIQNELFWLIELTLGDGEYTNITVNTMDEKLENIFVSTGTYEIIDAKDTSIHLNDSTNTKITDLKGYTKIYIMSDETSMMKFSGDTEWSGEYAENSTYLVKMEGNKMYMHSLAQEEVYFLNYTQTFNDEFADVFIKQTTNNTEETDTQKNETVEVSESAEKVNLEEIQALEDAKALVDSGADLNTQDDKNRVALMYASEKGHLEVVQYLVQNGAEINIWGGFESHDVPLLLASYNGHLDIVKYLLENGADINSTSEYASHTALILASITGHLDITKFLVENSADINWTDNEGYTALMWATDNGDVTTVAYLLEKGATSYSGDTIIDYALAGDLANVQKAIENGEDINLTEPDSINSALDYASMYGHTEIVKYLLENGADINSESGFGTTPLMYAAINGHLEVIKLLVENGADVDKRDITNVGQTALMFASQRGHLSTVKYLAPKSDINIVDDYGKTALDYAHSAEIEEYLMSFQ